MATRPANSAEHDRLSVEVAQLRKDLAALRRLIPKLSGHSSGKRVTSRKWMDHEDIVEIADQGEAHMDIRFGRPSEQSEEEKAHVAKRQALLGDWVDKLLLRPYATWTKAATDAAKRAMVPACDETVCFGCYVIIT